MKRIIAAALAFACVLLLASNAAYALDAKPSTLTVVIKYGDVPLDGIQTAVCLVAGVREADGTLVYEAVPAFAGAQADFTNLTAERNIALAASLNAYAAVHGIERGQKTTDSDGRAVFSGLVAGLYLIAQLDGENSEYIIDPYLVMVPGVNERTRVWDYDVTAQPKTEPVRRDLKVNSLSVYKVWSGTNTPPGGILVQLYRDGVPYGNCVALDAGNHWSHTWNNLNPENTWTVDEFDVAQGYTKAISASAGGFILTNTKNPNAPQTTVVIGSKTWEHGSNPAAQQPKSIVLRIYADGVFLLQKEVGEAEHWSWSVRMDKFDENGREIVYTVDEAPVNDYIKAVDGFDLVNIHKSYTRPDDTSRTNPYVRPITGDLSNPTLWLFLMGTSFAGLLVVAFLFRRSVKKREKRS